MPVSLARPLVAAQSSRGNGASDWHPGALVAENDPELLRLIVEALTRDGFIVSEARNAEELIEIAYCTRREDNSPPALVVSDVHLPGRDGLSALDELQQTLAGAVILVISAFPDDAVLAEAARVGAAGVLGKPFELDELRTTALNLVRR
ncbi:MAG: response regulator [Deltaproteobacteria bacterium]|jgi:DNA-binding response OmpR family regulator|nr:response regulator [Deltaproteobacteria bacterium]MBK7066189.1 response regulator [Deltaproteobacteria bacterium]MBK8696831.1 response regulator [Deltaproteobacteria bacterium]MBP6830485.1 response regulator [Deltaproteobacteria bacterium]